MISFINIPKHIRTFKYIVVTLVRNHELIWEMTKREIYDRYTGQVFGILWTIGHPLFLMGIYVYVFGVIFQIRTGGTIELPRNYPTYLLSGVIPWLTIQETMMKSCTSVISQANLVKQVVFPIEILPVKSALSSFVSQVIFTILFLIYILIVYRSLPWTCILIPVLFLFQNLAFFGVSFLFSSVSVFFRDLKDFVVVFCTAGLFILPIIYLPSVIPKGFMPFLYINPVSYVIWCYQDVFYFGRLEHPWAWPVFGTMSLVMFYSGYYVFNKLKTIFGNVL